MEACGGRARVGREGDGEGGGGSGWEEREGGKKEERKGFAERPKWEHARFDATRRSPPSCILPARYLTPLSLS